MAVSVEERARGRREDRQVRTLSFAFTSAPARMRAFETAVLPSAARISKVHSFNPRAFTSRSIMSAEIP